MLQPSIKKNILFNYIGQFYTIFVSIFMLPFYLKYLGSEAYGLVGFFTMVATWLVGLDLGLSGAILREIAKSKNSYKKLIKTKILIRSIEVFFAMILVVLVASIIYGSSYLANHWLNVQELPINIVQDCISAMAVMLVFRWFVGFYNGIVVGFEEQVWLNKYKIIINTLRFVGAFFLVKYISDNVLHFFIYQIIIGFLEVFIVALKVYSLLPKTKFTSPSTKALRKILPFSVSLAYTSITWLIFCQTDKLLLSHYIPLSEYGYFAIVAALSGGIFQISLPLTQALTPRMTSLLHNKQTDQMIRLYRNGTKVLAFSVVSIVVIMSYFSYELLVIWTSDIKASLWASPVLVWYMFGSGIVTIWSIQNSLQYAYGNLKYEVRFQTVFVPLALPIMFFVVSNYGAIGAGIAWFVIMLLIFLIWVPYIHYKFIPGMNNDWMIKDILPVLLVSVVFVFLLEIIDIDFSKYTDIESLFVIFSFGFTLLLCNMFIYKEVRERCLGFIWERYAIYRL